MATATATVTAAGLGAVGSRRGQGEVRREGGVAGAARYTMCILASTRSTSVRNDSTVFFANLLVGSGK